LCVCTGGQERLSYLGDSLGALPGCGRTDPFISPVTLPIAGLPVVGQKKNVKEKKGTGTRITKNNFLHMRLERLKKERKKEKKQDKSEKGRKRTTDWHGPKKS
jgi:hypothetical protein